MEKLNGQRHSLLLKVTLLWGQGKGLELTTVLRIFLLGLQLTGVLLSVLLLISILPYLHLHLVGALPPRRPSAARPMWDLAIA